MSNARAVNTLIDEVYRHTGVTFDETKLNLLRSRLRRRCRRLGLEGLEQYLELLQSRDGKAELSEFIDVVTTHKTSFFRTSSVWEALTSELTALAERQGRAEVWSAACSTGEEPCSIAITASRVAEATSRLRWSVLATDVSPLTLTQAASCSFDPAKVDASRGPGNEDLDRYFRTKGDDKVLVDALKARMTFAQHNLFHPRSATFDIVFVRNVIIYFTEDDKRKVIENVCRSLRPGGLLVIGESESLGTRFPSLQYEAPCLYRFQS